jgi:hypothetical protein
VLAVLLPPLFGLRGCIKLPLTSRPSIENNLYGVPSSALLCANLQQYFPVLLHLPALLLLCDGCWPIGWLVAQPPSISAPLQQPTIT